MYRNMIFSFSSIFAFFIILITNFSSTGAEREILNFNVGWKYYLGNPHGNPWQYDYDDESWESVSIPHSHRLFSLTCDDTDDNAEQQYWHRHVGWYRKSFKINDSGHKKIFLEFEGSYQVTDLWVNGHYVGNHSIGGYTPFHFDITDYVHTGSKNNIVAIKVDNRWNPAIPPDDGPRDYITPGGLYRDVYLVKTGSLYITFPWVSKNQGVIITTNDVSAKSAKVNIQVTVKNSDKVKKNCRVETFIYNDKEELIRKIISNQSLPKTSDHIFTGLSANITNPRLWDIDDPHLYKAVIKIYDNDNLSDTYIENFGIRWFEFRPDGFFLNGKNYELIGGNRHQQYPYIGNAVPNSLHRKDVVQMKQAGMNMVRLSHYPQDNAFIEACDELGLLVTEEPPTWNTLGNKEWQQNLEQAWRRCIRNHRNHPSILMWGAGINHLGCQDWLHHAAKEEDTGRLTHPIVSLNWPDPGGIKKKGICDIFSVMEFDEEFTVSDSIQFIIEHNRPLEHISSSKGNKNNFGLCKWSAHDVNTLYKNGGEDHIMRSGFTDIFRIPKDLYYWYKSELTDEPFIYIVRPVGEKPLTVYSNCDEIELFINGKSYGKKGHDNRVEWQNLKSPPFLFPVTYTSGNIRVDGFNGGKQVTSCSRKEPGLPYQLTVVPDMFSRNFIADGGDIVMVYVYVVDKNGTLVNSSDLPIKMNIKGPARIVGNGKGIGTNPVKADHGIASFLVRSTTSAGRIVLKANCSGIKSGTAEISTQITVNEKATGRK